MSELDLNNPDTARRLRAAWHNAGCSTQHGFADCSALGQADVTEEIDDFMTGLRRFGDRLEVDDLTNEQIGEAWHYGCRRLPREHTLGECDEFMRNLILREEVPDVVAQMLRDVSF